MQKNPLFSEGELSLGGKKWFLSLPLERKVLQAQQDYQISSYLAEFLVSRLKNLEDIPDFITPLVKKFLPDPSLLPDLDQGVALVETCLRQNKPIGVWGDYDVDGATASAFFIRYFKKLRHPCKAHIPNRFEEGYGLNIPYLEKMKEQGINHLITVDCGSSSHGPLRWARAQGMEVIVLDHHQTGSSFPEAHSFINPKRPDYQGPKDFEHLCAAGLAFVFLVGLNRHLRQAGFFVQKNIQEPNLMEMLDLAALGTVCDVMPLTSLNRALVTQGLRSLQKSPSLGLMMLSDVARIREKCRSYHLGYLLGPRINAGGRIGKSSLGVELLTTSQPEKAYRISQELDALNKTRQLIETTITNRAYQQASHMKNKEAIIVHGEKWHEGVLGIVAGRLKETFHKPSFVMSFNDVDGKGSARSIKGVDLGALLGEALANSLVLSGGGHAMAGAFRLKKEKLKEFEAFVFHFIHRLEGDYDRQPSIVMEKVIQFKALQDPELLEALEALEPMGSGNAHPKFLIPQVRFEKAAPFGQGHLKLIAYQERVKCEMVCFRPVLHMLDPSFSWTDKLFDCSVSVQSAEFKGAKKLRVILDDLKVSSLG